MTQKNLLLIDITPYDLPLHCSGINTEIWNGHPRVFLPIQSYGQIECPYCGAIYRLNGETKSH